VLGGIIVMYAANQSEIKMVGDALPAAFGGSVERWFGGAAMTLTNPTTSAANELVLGYICCILRHSTGHGCCWIGPARDNGKRPRIVDYKLIRTKLTIESNLFARAAGGAAGLSARGVHCTQAERWDLLTIITHTNG